MEYFGEMATDVSPPETIGDDKQNGFPWWLFFLFVRGGTSVVQPELIPVIILLQEAS